MGCSCSREKKTLPTLAVKPSPVPPVYAWILLSELFALEESSFSVVAHESFYLNDFRIYSITNQPLCWMTTINWPVRKFLQWHWSCGEEYENSQNAMPEFVGLKMWVKVFVKRFE
ncbi:hypothetical protein CEXT_547311 [Caerostris extrusa]|uniref:Uncharacterized protein n=1 Tax=Caerostris extrusa TaxID=172846 RepID=A0AAV4WE54_CAEEX|nr:hypothetical protein CEXT_547311 [Caerostris extrusa]